LLRIAIEGITTLLNPISFLYLVAGVGIGLIFGVTPGLGGVTALAILISLTYRMTTNTAFALLIGAASAAAFGGSISAILINVPGTSQNVATCLDGYPMTRKGQGARAVAISATASALGGVIGGIALLLLVPVVRQLVMAFAPPEYFMLCVLGLTAIASVSGKSLVRGLIAGTLGVLLSFVGYDPVTGIPRFTMGSLYLYDGIDMITALIGLFAVSEMIGLIVEGKTIARVETSQEASREQVWEGIKDVFRHWSLFLRSSVLGTLVGITPGVGGATGSVIAYSQAVQTSRHPEKFGTGIPEGVIAPEAANNATFGGALVPTVAFGIPGSEMCVVLLGAFMLHGLVPGPQMMKTNLPLVFLIGWGVVIANIIASGLGLVLVRWLLKLVYVPIEMLAPPVVVICFLGAYATTGHVQDVVISFLFGILGYWMKKASYPLAPVIIGFVLGSLAEVNYHLAIQIYGTRFLTRPITLVLIALTVGFVVVPLVNRSVRRGEQTA
jgi:putative tricarboxylic transport membrane protein